MTRPLDPYEKIASRKESELGGDGWEYTLLIAEERRDPREDPEKHDYLEVIGSRGYPVRVRVLFTHYRSGSGDPIERTTLRVYYEIVAWTRNKGGRREYDVTIKTWRTRFRRGKVLLKRATSQQWKAFREAERRAVPPKEVVVAASGGYKHE
jgi:hypothetical protein